MGAIYLKEIKSYFKSFFGWLFLAVFSFFSGLFFVIYNLNYGNPYISSTISGLFIITLFVLPVLTMRVFTEEKKQKTDQLLLTAPVRLWTVVLGKFLALATLMLASCFVLVVGCLIMSIYGTIPLAETLLALAGFFLFGCICISVGMLLSAVTEHQFVAVILTYGVFVFILLIPSFCKILFGESSWICKALTVIDIITPFDKMFQGVVVLQDIFYVISAIFIMLLLCCRIFGKNTWKIGAVGAKKFIISNVGILLIIALIVGANFGVRKISSAYTEFDLTDKGLYTISDTTKNLLKELDEELTIYVIGKKDEIDSMEAPYLDKYESLSKYIKVEYRPYDLYPRFVDAYSDTYLEDGSLILVKGDKFRIVQASDLFISTFNYMYYTQERTGIDVEGQITAAIASLIDDVTYRVCYTTGHDEMELSQHFVDRLKKGGYEASEINLITDDIPDDCAVFLVNGPDKDLTKDEVRKLNEYVNNGGNLVLLASLVGLDTPNYNAFMSQFGATLTDEVVLERDPRQVYNNNPSYLLLLPRNHEITSRSLKRVFFFWITRGFILDENNTETYVTPLFVTNETSYLKAFNEGESGAYKEGDATGAFPTALYINKPLENGGKGEILEIGTPGFIYEDMDALVSYANTDVVISSINFMVDRTLDSSVPFKSLDYEQIVVNTGMVFLYAGIFMLLLPFTLVITGIVIVILRRKK